VRSKELDRLLEVADELVDARAALARMESLQHEIAHESAIAAAAPEVAAVVAARRPPIEHLARELEQQWVAQGPLVSIWQRAVELSQLAEASGADPADYRPDIDRARQQVESARLETRDVLDRLCTQREALADAILAAPFPLPTPPPVRDDGRPEAGRRDALDMLDLADEAIAMAEHERHRARQRISEASAEAAELGDPAELAARVSELEQRLPDVVELPTSAQPSTGMRLQRAGVRTTVATNA
jgi:cell division septum initiation protein DivIVA